MSAEVIRHREMFSDRELEEQFTRNGFVRMSLLSESHIRALLGVYQQFDSGLEQPFYTSIWSEDRRYRSAVDKRLKEILLPVLKPVLSECRPVFSNLMVKKAVPDSEIGVHQDWTMVDEERFRAINVWIPLVDTDCHNGALRIVKRSHKMKSVIRGRGIASQFDEIQCEIKRRYLTTIAVKAGEAVFFDERLIHCSGDNLSGSMRLAASIVMIPSEADIVHFFGDASNVDRVRKLVVQPEFFTEFGLFDSLEACGKETVPFDLSIRQVSLKSFTNEYQALNRQ